ncbi:uncharacterized protein (TIGR03083 family) [Leucobacter luti]|uniref:maleylpyruvate isomerase family mycothiol-dependent enzyme n=1 Tax=Leucobacter luti TaxID=340320 RepID=UPI0010EDE6C8|nr:maleylpyruvate isomerase family mycothiol-dependent enzyme [Leucobacter luti]MCW2286926.1 uncharacterized protein (TIGR03083 family) [Leucobacter luti]TCK41155.1 uncharacterized protein (TIGR03083 family) [Leucobacter luti]
MTLTPAAYWELIHAERARVVAMLERLTPEQWAAGSLCAEWNVEQVAAHLTAAAHMGTVAWLRSIVLAGFNPARHNSRRLAERLGETPVETLDQLRASLALTVAPTKDYAAWLGEVIVHGQDIARALGIELVPDPAAVREVAEFYAAKDFAVNSRSQVRGLRLEASDGADPSDPASRFSTGTGPVVRGPLLDLVLAMAGRPSACERLDGEGAAELRKRLA